MLIPCALALAITRHHMPPPNDIALTAQVYKLESGTHLHVRGSRMETTGGFSIVITDQKDVDLTLAGPLRSKKARPLSAAIAGGTVGKPCQVLFLLDRGNVVESWDFNVVADTRLTDGFGNYWSHIQLQVKSGSDGKGPTLFTWGGDATLGGDNRIEILDRKDGAQYIIVIQVDPAKP